MYSRNKVIAKTQHTQPHTPQETRTMNAVAAVADQLSPAELAISRHIASERAIARSLTKNRNVQWAIEQHLGWLRSYPGDAKGAALAAGDMIDNATEADELIRC